MCGDRFAMTSNSQLEKVIALAMEVEVEDPIDWGMLAIDETAAYHLMATNVLEQMAKYEPSEREDILLATVVKLVVENFVLNLKLQERTTWR